jgi:hypothetical protein
MNRTQFFVVLALYLVGVLACTQWAVSLGSTRVLGLVLWTSFFAFCNALVWVTYWSREHWMG